MSWVWTRTRRASDRARRFRRRSRPNIARTITPPPTTAPTMMVPALEDDALGDTTTIPGAGGDTDAVADGVVLAGTVTRGAIAGQHANKRRCKTNNDTVT